MDDVMGTTLDPATDGATVEITSYEELREVVGTPSERVAAKVRPALVQTHRDWLAVSPFCLVATSDAAGRCDVSPKGDPPGFTVVLDDHTIAIPERPGNRRVDGYLNVLENPHVGLVYLLPGRGDTLRINGRARIIRDAPYFADMVVKGHRPLIAMEVAIEEVFFHCSKAFLRSALWKPESWQPEAAPSRPAIAKLLERPGDTMQDLEQYYGDDYAKKLYTTD